MDKKVHRGTTSNDISRPDLKIRNSGDRLMRADVRRGMSSAQDDEASEFYVLPLDRARHCDHRWLIEFEGMQGSQGPIRIEVAGDVVLGRWRGSEAEPDFDMGIYTTDEKGVSRQHAILRPSAKNLYLIDLESRNGTYINNIRVSSAAVNSVHDGDILSLGVMSFKLRIIASPSG